MLECLHDGAFALLGNVDLVAKPIGMASRALCASPSYLKRLAELVVLRRVSLA